MIPILIDHNLDAMIGVANVVNGWRDYDRLVSLWYHILPRAQEIAEAVPNATWLEWS